MSTCKTFINSSHYSNSNKNSKGLLDLCLVFNFGVFLL